MTRVFLGRKVLGEKPTSKHFELAHSRLCVWRRDSNTARQKLEVTATTARIIIMKGTTRHHAHIKHKRENNLNRKRNKKSFCTVRAYVRRGACVDVGGEQFMLCVFGSPFHDINVLWLRWINLMSLTKATTTANTEKQRKEKKEKSISSRYTFETIICGGTFSFQWKRFFGSVSNLESMKMGSDEI